MCPPWTQATSRSPAPLGLKKEMPLFGIAFSIYYNKSLTRYSWVVQSVSTLGSHQQLLHSLARLLSIKIHYRKSLVNNPFTFSLKHLKNIHSLLTYMIHFLSSNSMLTRVLKSASLHSNLFFSRVVSQCEGV